MIEQKGQDSAGAPEETETMELAKHFRIIGRLAKRAAQGDEEALSMLQILENQQLAEIQGLSDKLVLVVSRGIMNRIARNAL